jgi:hypothetical protein
MSDYIKEMKTVKTRKKHTCQGCCVDIDIGDSALTWSGFDAGEFFSVYLCGSCGEIYLENQLEINKNILDGAYEGFISDYVDEYGGKR